MNFARTDYQRKRVYEWEKGFWLGGFVGIHSPFDWSSATSMEQAMEIITSLSKDFDVPAPNVLAMNPRIKKWSAAYHPQTTSIWLPKVFGEGQVLHEFAHHVALMYSQENCLHGPMFVRSMIEICANAGYRHVGEHFVVTDARSTSEPRVRVDAISRHDFNDLRTIRGQVCVNDVWRAIAQYETEKV